MKIDQMYELRADDVLEILLGKYFYEIIFETDSTGDQQTDSPSAVPPVTAMKDTNGIWESVDDGKMLIFTSNNLQASNKVFTILNKLCYSVVCFCIITPFTMIEQTIQQG